jgi:hypothetical protein
VPLTELIGPENGDPATDSDGDGQYAAAMNSTASGAHSDWRSQVFETVPGEELFWSFDFKFLNYVDTNFPIGEGFRIELRSFDGQAPDGGNGGTFAGEQTVYVYISGYGPDGNSGGYVTGGSIPHPPSAVTVVNFNDGQWHTLSSDIFGDQNSTDDNNLWKIPSLAGGNPAEGLFTDIRVSVNAFTAVNTDQLQVLIDNVSVVRPIEGLPGDYNEDGIVNAADYVVWRKNPAGFGGDPAGYNTWVENFGEGVPGAGGSGAVPEPGGMTALVIAVAFLAAGRRGNWFLS